MEDTILFQEARIKALENEVKRLKQALAIRETNLTDHLIRLTELKNDPVFNQPILTKQR